MASNFVFLESLPLRASVRDRELQQAQARKHAARVSHARKKHQKTPLTSQRHGFATLPISQARVESDSVGPIDGEHQRKTVRIASPPVIKKRRRRGVQAQPMFKCRFRILAQDSQHRMLMPSSSKPRVAQIQSRYREKDRLRDSDDGNQQERRSGIVNTPPDSDKGALDSNDLEWLRRKGYRYHPMLFRSTVHLKPLYDLSGGDASSFYRGCEYFARVLVPNYAPVFDIFNVSNIYTDYTFHLFQRTFVVHTWLGMMHLLKSALAPKTSSQPDHWRHTGVGLTHLRKAMALDQNHCTSDHVIISVQFLAHLARVRGDISEYEMHIRNLKLLIKDRGGLDKLGYEGLLKACILQFDGIFADNAKPMFGEDRCLVPPVYLDRGGMPPSLLKRVSELPPGFEQLALTAKLPVDLIEVLSRLVAYSDDQKAMETRQQLGVGFKERRFADFWESCSSLATPGPTFCKFLCLSLLLYTSTVLCPVRGAISGMSMYASSRRLLTQQVHLLESQITGQDGKDCWIWIWMVVIGSWSERDCLTTAGVTLLVHFHQQFPELRTWSQLDQVLARFFYPQTFQASCKTSWDSLHVEVEEPAGELL